MSLSLDQTLDSPCSSGLGTVATGETRSHTLRRPARFRGAQGYLPDSVLQDGYRTGYGHRGPRILGKQNCTFTLLYADRCGALQTEGCSGAEIASICQDAALITMNENLNAPFVSLASIVEGLADSSTLGSQTTPDGCGEISQTEDHA